LLKDISKECLLAKPNNKTNIYSLKKNGTDIYIAKKQIHTPGQLSADGVFFFFKLQWQLSVDR